MQIKCTKGQMMAEITRIFAQNLGQAPKEAAFCSFSNAIQHVFIMKPFEWLSSSHLWQKNPLKKTTKPNPGIFSGSVLLIYFPVFLNWGRSHGTVWHSHHHWAFLEHGWWTYYIHHRPGRIHLISEKTAWGKNFHSNQSEVRRLKFLGVNCQVGQHSSLSCNSASFLQRGFYTGGGVGATQPNWLLRVCMCLLLKCPPSLQPHNLFGPSL